MQRWAFPPPLLHVEAALLAQLLVVLRVAHRAVHLARAHLADKHLAVVLPVARLPVVLRVVVAQALLLFRLRAAHPVEAHLAVVVLHQRRWSLPRRSWAMMSTGSLQETAVMIR